MSLLVTGAAGFIGSSVVRAALVAGRSPKRLVVAVRSRARFLERLAQQHRSALCAGDTTASSSSPQLSEAELMRRAELIPVAEGDLAELTSPRNDGAWLHGVTRVIHAAANTSYRCTLSSSAAANVALSEQLLAHCLRARPASAKHRPFERFVHVSSAFACGNHYRNALLDERDFLSAEPSATAAADPDPATASTAELQSANHFYNYTYTKAVAEVNLLRMARAADFPGVLIARPSIVVGDSASGCAVSGSIFFAFRALNRLSITGWPLHHRIDVVPADWTARALLRLATETSDAALARSGSTLHLTAGESANDWTQIGRAFALARDPVACPIEPLTASVSDTAASVAAPYHAVSAPEFRELVNSRNASFSSLFPFRTRSFAFAMRLYAQFAGLNTRFSNSRLRALGIDPPPSFVDYLPLCVRTSSPLLQQLSEDF